MPSAYPWGALEPLPRAAVRLARGARQALRLEADRVAGALSELLELPCEVLVRKCGLGRPASNAQCIWLGAERLAVGLLAEPALATFLAARILRRSEPLASPEAPLSAALAAVLAALSVEAARRAGIATTLLAEPPTELEALVASFTLLLDGRPFSLTVFVVGAATASREPALADLGPVTLSLPLVVASVVLESQELSTLEEGGALLLGEEAGIDVNGVGRGLLVTPSAERGIAVQLHADGRLVLGERAEARLSVERDESQSNESQTLNDVLLDTPVVVRVELGAVSMTAREWAQLGPGDVIETGQRIAEPVVLRIAGREVGRGELVNVDGHVGVRVQKLYEGS